MRPVLRVPTAILYRFKADRWENVHFYSKPRHVIPQIDLLGEMRPVLRVSNSHLYRFQADRWKNAHFSTKPRHVTPQIDQSRKNKPCSEGFWHILYGVSQEIDGKMFIFKVNLGMWPLKSIVLRKTSPVLRVSTHIYGASKEIWRENVHF